jgi:hypothetical protein
VFIYSRDFTGVLVDRVGGQRSLRLTQRKDEIRDTTPEAFHIIERNTSDLTDFTADNYAAGS